MNYESQKTTRTFKSDVTGGSYKYRLSYIVSNNVGEAVNDITATIHKVAMETVDGQQVENLSRVGSANISVATNRCYVSFDKFSEVPAADRIALSTKFHEDADLVLTETV